jgi:hypothetical protein
MKEVTTTITTSTDNPDLFLIRITTVHSGDKTRTRYVHEKQAAPGNITQVDITNALSSLSPEELPQTKFIPRVPQQILRQAVEDLPDEIRPNFRRDLELYLQ